MLDKQDLLLNHNGAQCSPVEGAASVPYYCDALETLHVPTPVLYGSHTVGVEYVVYWRFSFLFCLVKWDNSDEEVQSRNI